jgi:UDP-N-acetyl-D-glucosamine dehydrogenase
MKVSVIGQGYVGLNIAVAAASAGHSVVGLDIDADLIKNLNLGINHVPGISQEVIKSLIQANSYTPTTDSNKIVESEVIVIAVPTPLDSSRRPDLSYLEAASKIIGEYASINTLVVNESTSYPGTLRKFIKPLVEQNGDRSLFFAAAPERVDPGNTDWNLENTPRVVAGIGEVATQKVQAFYSSFCKFIHVAPNVEVAEASKLFENTFRQVNIALVNEFSEIAQSLNFSTHDAIAAAATKPFGYMAFLPSIGVGGHCIPVDPSYLSYIAGLSGVKTNFIDLANDTNYLVHKKIIVRIKDHVGGVLKGKRIQVAGIAYKPNVSDLRESPALLLIEELKKSGAEVFWCDPLVKEFNGKVSNPLSADIDIGLIVTPHDQLDFSIWKNSNITVLDISACTRDFGWPKFL